MNRIAKMLLIVLACSSFLVVYISGGQAQKGGEAQGKRKGSMPTQQPPAPVLSPVIPRQVPAHQSTTPEGVRPFFDYFSWESFVALNWPAAIDPNTNLPIRGMANTSQGVSIGSPGPRVWETLKADWELFAGNGSNPPSPSAFSSYQASVNPCPSSTPYTKILVMSTKMDSALNDVQEAFAGPLIAQNNTFARFEIRLNQTEYEYIVNPPPPFQPLYLSANLPTNNSNPINFPSTTMGTDKYGAIEIKASWRELKGDDDSRYYWVNAQLVVGPNQCRPAKMGLVGLHIGHKVAPFREWVWSTFEQVDNVPPLGPDPPNCAQTQPSGTFSFNKGGVTNPAGYDYNPPTPSIPLAPNPAPPVEVNRVTDLDPQTKCLNSQFQQLLAGTVWQYYMLVATQWPTQQGNFTVGGTYPVNSDTPFPADPVANTTMETYYQAASTPLSSCMDCHYQTAITDFSWVTALEAWSPPSTARASRLRLTSTPVGRAIQKLRQVLQQNRVQHDRMMKLFRAQQMKKTQKRK
jgi:hypothetical protein